MNLRLLVIRLLACAIGWAGFQTAIRASVPVPPQSAAPGGATNTQVILVLGAPGEPKFAEDFARQAAAWRSLAEKAGAEFRQIGEIRPEETVVAPAALGADARESDPDAAPTPVPVPPPADEPPATGGDSANPPPGPTDREQLQTLLAQITPAGPGELWLVLVGHGTFDGKIARFNLRGPDITAADLAEWLRPVRRPLAVINTASSSAPFLKELSSSNRVVITATRSGHELNYARFGRYFVEAIADPKSDLDGDGQVSLLEAFLGASHAVADFYKSEGRLATEHPLIDDTADGLGTPPDWFRGLRPVRKAQGNAPLDGLLAHQFHLLRSPEELALSPEIRARRNQLEREIAVLRESRDKLDDERYYSRLETLLLDLARLYEDSQPSPSVE